MGLFDNLVKKATAAIETKAEDFNKKMEDFNRKMEDFQKKMTEPFDDSAAAEPKKQVRVQMQQCEQLNPTQMQIINKFYFDYPEKPYIAADRESNWIERAEMFPASMLVKKQMMKRYADKLLPGHVYMLYWLKKYTNKKVPVYFEYKYGIDFEKEKEFLFLNGFLDETNKPTAKGEAAIQKHAKVIENHTPPKPVWNYEEAKKQTLQQRNSLRINGFKEYEVVSNKNCCDICAKLNGKHFPLSALKIGVNAPPMHEGCSCSICAYTDRAEYEAWLDSISKRNRRK